MKTHFKRSTKLFTEKPAYKSIGYARQSSYKSISIGGQVQALKDAGCMVVFQETISSASKDRPQFDNAISSLNEGDEIVFTKLDRGFRNQRECINTLNDLQDRGIHVRTLDNMINTRALGKFAPIVIGLLSGLAEVERQMIIERTNESIEYRKANNGNLGGRPKTNDKKEKLVLRLRKEGNSYRSIRSQTGIALSTIRRIIVEQESIKDLVEA